MIQRRHRRFVTDIEAEIRALEARREEIDSAISRLRRRAALWRDQAGPPEVVREEVSPQSLTHYCRAVVRSHAHQGLTPREVRQHMTIAGFNWSRYVNPMAAVHTVLKRLVSQGEAASRSSHDGPRRYFAVHTRSVALALADVRDEAFVKQLLEASSPDEVMHVVPSPTQELTQQRGPLAPDANGDEPRLGVGESLS